MAGELGMEIDLDACPDLEELPDDVALFSESCGRFVVTTSVDAADGFEQRFAGLACCRVGTVTTDGRVRVRSGKRTLLDNDIAALKAAYKETLADV